jgi:para-nitrobenzyl esterase
MSSENQADFNPIVQTSHGKVCGTRALGIATFRGIPYGASTGGSNRFLPPQPPKQWTGVRDAFRLGNQCPQLNADLVGLYADESPMSEDCLYLNVWSPADVSAESAEKLTVMVCIHGGAFESGSGGSQAYDCQNLARLGKLVCVSGQLNIYAAMALMKRSPKMTANCAFAMDHSRGRVFHSFSDPFIAD